MMKLIVKEDWNTGHTYFYLKESDDRQNVIIGQKDGKLISQRFDIASAPIEVQPLLQMPHHIADQLLKAFAEYLSDKNVKTDNENLLQGKLAATERHLKDMQTISMKALEKLLGKNSDEICGPQILTNESSK